MRHGLRIGDVVVMKTRTIRGWFIRKLTGSEYNHVGIYAGKNMVIESYLFMQPKLTYLYRPELELFHAFRARDKNLRLQVKDYLHMRKERFLFCTHFTNALFKNIIKSSLVFPHEFAKSAKFKLVTLPRRKKSKAVVPA